MSNVTFKISLDAKSKEEKKHLFLSVTHKRKTRQFSLGIDSKLTKEEFNNPRLKITKEAFDQAKPLYSRAADVIKELGDDFSFIKFRARFNGGISINTDMSTDINDVFNHYIHDHRSNAQGTIDCYKTIVTHLTQFKKGIKITDLDVDMILQLQDYIRDTFRKKYGKEMSETTMAIYMRSLRALYNYAQIKLNLPPENYPFGRYKISITSSTSSHRAMTDEDFDKFINYIPRNKNEEFAHTMFFISFGLSGMNTADILNIKNKNIKNNTELEYVREKTKNRTTKLTTIEMNITPEVMSLIKKYAVIEPDSPNNYIFPFFTSEMSEKQKLRKRKDITSKINQYLKEICTNIGIEPITSYWARHTVATKLYNTGISSEVISKLLGHSSVTTTNIYLGQLGLKKKEEVQDKISNFLKDIRIG